MFIEFVRDFVGNVGSGYDFILVITACVLLIVVVGLILSLFLGAFTSLTHKFFK